MTTWEKKGNMNHVSGHRKDETTGGIGKGEGQRMRSTSWPTGTKLSLKKAQKDIRLWVGKRRGAEGEDHEEGLQNPAGGVGMLFQNGNKGAPKSSRMNKDL